MADPGLQDADRRLVELCGNPHPHLLHDHCCMKTEQ